MTVSARYRVWEPFDVDSRQLNGEVAVQTDCQCCVYAAKSRDTNAECQSPSHTIDMLKQQVECRQQKLPDARQQVAGCFDLFLIATCCIDKLLVLTGLATTTTASVAALRQVLAGPRPSY